MRSPPPRTHPAPHQSTLWPHWQVIGELRRSKKTWKQIAAELKDSYRISISAGSVRNFFKRATQGRLLLGVARKVPASRPRVVSTNPTILARPPKQLEEPDGDPFSVKVIQYDPWKPQRKSKAS
jgi:hypothetical protein